MAGEPVLSFLLNRHGMRHPFLHFEGIGDHVEPEQLAILTERGHKQMAALGDFLAKKHGLKSTSIASTLASFLSSQIITPEVYASSVQRCIDSAQILFKSFLQKDVPVTLLKVDYHNMYHPMIAKNIDRMMAAEFHTPRGDTVGQYVNYLNEQAKSTKTLTTDKYQIIDALLTANQSGHPLPSYADYDTLDRCLNVMLPEFLPSFKLALGGEILSDMRERLNELPKVRANFVCYSVSDIHIASILDLLAIPIGHWPGYGEAVELKIFADGSAVLDELVNSPEAVVTEKPAVQRTDVDKLKKRISDALA